MTDAFPPTATDCTFVEALVSAFATVTEPRSATYVSSPLTTGPRAFEWHRRNGGQDDAGSFHEDVIEPNREDAARFTRSLRAKSKRVVIDPTALLDVPTWTQSDYRYFWGRVIEQCCSEVVFRHGWQFSSGCAYELLIGWESQCRLVREDGNLLSLRDARALLDEAIRVTTLHQTGSAFLSAVRTALEHPRGYAWRT